MSLGHGSLIGNIFSARSRRRSYLCFRVVPQGDCLGPFCAPLSIDLHVCYNPLAMCSSYFLPIQWHSTGVLEQKIYTSEALMGLKLIFGKKSKSSGVRMGLFSMLGKFLFVWFFIVSAIQTIFMFENYETTREDYAAKVSGFMDFLERYFGVTSTGKVYLIGEFLTIFNILRALGGLLFLHNEMILNMCGTYLLMFCFMISTPIVYDFYLYKVGDPDFLILLHGFMQNMAFCGALLFLKEMRWTIYQIQWKKKTLKSKSKSKSKSK